MKNIKRYLLISTLALFCGNLFSANLQDQIKKIKLSGVDVTWLEDDRFPTYGLMIYFNQGAIKDKKSGEVNAYFNNLTSGTNSFTQEAIADTFDYYGVSLSPNITHEYVSYGVGGLVKDFIPTMKMVCHLFEDATIPEKELTLYKNRSINSLKAIVNEPDEVADRAFRALSLDGTPYSKPVTGLLKDVSTISRQDLLEVKKEFNQNIKKRIFIYGPKDLLKLETIINTDCRFLTKGEESKSSLQVSQIKKKKTHYLLTLPEINQTQIRMGTFLSQGSYPSDAILSLTSTVIGNGSSSVLNHEVRVKHGLTYNISSFASAQKEYARSGIMTSTKSERTQEMLNVIEEAIKVKAPLAIDGAEFERAKNFLTGSFMLRYEDRLVLLGHLLWLEHTGKSLDQFFNSEKLITAITPKESKEALSTLFNSDEMLTLIVGPESVKKQLKVKPNLIKLEDIL